MKKSILLLVVCVQVAAFSQEVSLAHKHEVGINLGSFILPVFAPEYRYRRIEGSFVTNYENQFSLRLKLTGIRAEDYNDFSNLTPAYRVDSVYIDPEHYTEKQYSQKWQSAIRLYAGLERNFNFKNISLYGGLSGVISVEKDVAQLYDYDYVSEGVGQEHIVCTSLATLAGNMCVI